MRISVGIYGDDLKLYFTINIIVKYIINLSTIFECIINHLKIAQNYKLILITFENGVIVMDYIPTSKL